MMLLKLERKLTRVTQMTQIKQILLKVASQYKPFSFQTIVEVGKTTILKWRRSFKLENKLTRSWMM
jgi:hypothetical protein